MQFQTTAQRIASLLVAIENCRKSENAEWLERHRGALVEIMASAPSGSGINSGIELLPESTPNCLKFSCDFHHMNDGGYYDGWTEHKAVVRPSLAFGLEIRITGRDRNGIKEYLHDVFSGWLTEFGNWPTTAKQA